MSFRIDVKILRLVSKALNGQAPDYMWDLLTPYEHDLVMVPTLDLSIKMTGSLLLGPLSCGTPCLEISGR